jgi:predicted Zn-dependent peptidase
MTNQYVAKNTILCLAGNIETDTVLTQAKKYFSKIKIGEPNKKLKVIENQQKSECLLEDKNTGQTHICLGVRGYNTFHPDKYVLEILGIILGRMHELQTIF